MTIPIPIGDRTMTIPVEITSGRNWGKFDKDNPEANPHGMKVLDV